MCLIFDFTFTADPREGREVQAGGAQERSLGNDGSVGRPHPNGHDRPRLPLLGLS